MPVSKKPKLNFYWIKQILKFFTDLKFYLFPKLSKYLIPKKICPEVPCLNVFSFVQVKTTKLNLNQR